MRTQAEYEQALRRFFQEVARAGIKNVVVDLRYNTGGNSRVADLFMQYLPVDSYLSFGSTIRYSPEARTQRKYLQARGHVTHPPGRRSNQVLKDLVFAGNLYVLTSPQTFSSGKWFAVLLKDNGLATLVGEPTGNAPSASGDILSFNLPHSGCAFIVSHKQFVRPSGDTTERCVSPM
ncbi:MAG: S41 family peptidase [Bacillota bacterium]